MVKHPPANGGDMGSSLVVSKIPFSRKWQPTPVLLPGDSQGQRSLVGCSPWGRKESGMTGHACTHIHLFNNKSDYATDSQNAEAET